MIPAQAAVQARHLHADGWTVSAIARHLDRDRRTIRAYLAGRERLRIVDLGCGTGSNLRALAPLLGPRQHWRLVDYDADLLVEHPATVISTATVAAATVGTRARGVLSARMYSSSSLR